MSNSHHPVPPPQPWSTFRASVRYRILHPLLFLDWLLRHLAFYLSRWSLLIVLEYAGNFSVLVVVVLYFAESGERRQQKHYQAWQVINTAQGKGGSGGRLDALQQLNDDHVSLTGVDVSGAYLRGLVLENAELRRANFSSADLRDAVLRGSRLDDATLHYTNFRNADLSGADLSGALLDNADFTGANLSDANLGQTNGWETCDGLESCKWEKARNLPPALMARLKAPAATMPSTQPSPRMSTQKVQPAAASR